MISVFNIKDTESLFERLNYQVDLQPNATYPLKSVSYRRNSQTRVAFVGEPGTHLSLVCNINFSKCRRRGGVRRSRECRPGGCSDDYFYIGRNLNSRIRGAEYYCGKRTIRKRSRITEATQRPVLVVGKNLIDISCDRAIKGTFFLNKATSATSRGLFGKYKCIIHSSGNATHTPPAGPAPANNGMYFNSLFKRVRKLLVILFFFI